MSNTTDQALHALHSDTLSASTGVVHGFYNRHGGVSTGPFASLNVSYAQDDSTNVIENRRRITHHLSTTSSSTSSSLPSNYINDIPSYLPRLTHTTNVVILRDPLTQTPETVASLHADAIVTKLRRIVIGVYAADCAPVLLCDDTAGVIAAMHVGWRGLADGIVENTLSAMVDIDSSNRVRAANVRAALGPCIRQRNYEVGPEFVERFVGIDQENERFFCRVEGRERPFFDLAGCVARRLERNGVGNCDDVGVCTMDDERMFSYRRNVKSGVNGFGCHASVIMLT